MAVAAEKMIKKLEAIGHLTHSEREAIRQLPMNTRAWAGKNDIFSDGEAATQCCLLMKGWVCRYKMLEDGGRQILSFHLPGEIPDLQSLHLKVMDHSLRAITDCELAFISHRDLNHLALEFPGIGKLLWRDTLIDSAIFREWMVRIGRLSAVERTAHLLCELYVKCQALGLAQGTECEIPVTQIDLSDALGISAVHMNRVVQEMRADHLIILENRSLRILNWPELKRRAQFDPTYLHLNDN